MTKLQGSKTRGDKSSARPAVQSVILTEMALLLIYLRGNPSSALTIQLLPKLADMLDYRLPLGECRHQIEMLRYKMSEECSAYMETAQFRLSRTEETRAIEPADFRLLTLICRLGPELAQHQDLKLMHDYADAFHGFPEALSHKGIRGRLHYFKAYFRPFLKKWGSLLPPETRRQIERWKFDTTHFWQRAAERFFGITRYS